MYDLRAPAPVDVAALLDDEGTQKLLAAAGIALDEELTRQIEAAFSKDDIQARARVGNVYLPFVIRPGDEPFYYPWRGRKPLESRPETYTAVYLASPWKIGGGFRTTQYSIRGRLYDGWRQGDQVIVIRAEDPASRYVDAILPTRSAPP